MKLFVARMLYMLDVAIVKRKKERESETARECEIDSEAVSLFVTVTL